MNGQPSSGSSGACWIWRPGTTTLLTIACALAQASYGYDSTIGSIAPDRVTLSFDIDMNLFSYGSPQFAGGFTVTFGIGSVVGALLTIFLGDLLGRKKSVAIGAAAVLLGSVFQVAASNAVLFSIGRVLSGLGCGFNSASAPVWQVETAETRLRGRLILLQLVAKAVGEMVGSWVVLAYSPIYATDGSGDYYTTNDVPWRFPIGMQLLPTAILLLIIPWLPESPRWLMRKGRTEAATWTVSRLLRRPIDDPFVNQFLVDLSSPSEYGYETPLQLLKGVFRTCCCRRTRAAVPHRRQVRRWRRLALGSALQFLALWSGYAAFQDFFTSYNRPFSNRQRDILKYASVTWYVVFAALSVGVIEILGRRRSMMIAFSGQACCGLILTCISAANDRTTQVFFATLTFSAIGQCFSGFNYGLPWLYQLEINAWSLRLAGTAFAQVVQYLSSFTLVYGWSFMVSEVHPDTLYILPMLVSVIATGLVYFLYPETTGRTPQELDLYYSNGPSPWVWKQQNAVRVRTQQPDDLFATEISEPKA